jgi:hypothetical protein
MNEQNQNQTQKINQAHSEAATQAEPKTVINGKVVSLQQAQAAEAAFNKTMNQTGIQKHHDNSTEAVDAGAVASQSMSTAEAAAAQGYNQQAVKATDVQSGQAELEKAMQGAGQQQEQAGSQETLQQQNQKAAQAAQTAQDQGAMQTETQKAIQRTARAAQKKGE